MDSFLYGEHRLATEYAAMPVTMVPDSASSFHHHSPKPMLPDEQAIGRASRAVPFSYK